MRLEDLKVKWRDLKWRAQDLIAVPVVIVVSPVLICLVLFWGLYFVYEQVRYVVWKKPYRFYLEFGLTEKQKKMLHNYTQSLEQACEWNSEADFEFLSASNLDGIAQKQARRYRLEAYDSMVKNCLSQALQIRNKLREEGVEGKILAWHENCVKENWSRKADKYVEAIHETELEEATG